MKSAPATHRVEQFFFFFFRFLRPLLAKYKLLALNSFMFADKCRKKLDNCIVVVSGNTIIGVFTT